MADTMEVQTPQIKAPPEPESTLRILYDSRGGESPFPEMHAAVAPRGGDNMYGAFSIEKFAQQASLEYTHEDTAGFINYVAQFNKPNFWYQDSNVRVWAYYEQYDDWLDTYGMDAVRAVYHSGHGGMDGNGVFYAPMGADWGGLGTTALSSQMQLGNEHVKYIFWSTCLSCRVLDGQSPVRTWGPVNKGFRMLFGFETTSVDSPDYGKNLWSHWNKGESFSTAWLNASWDISHNQAPSVTACGATAAEAQDRVFNERLFYADPVSTAWWWWRWYYASKAAAANREPQRALPKTLLIAHLRPIEVAARIRDVVDRFGLDMKVPPEVRAARDGSFRLSEGDARVGFGGDGSFHVSLAPPNRSNRTLLPVRRAISIANEAVRRYHLGDEAPLVLDQVRLAGEAGTSASGSGQVDGPYTTGTVVQFRQVVNGLAVLSPNAGAIRVAIDNDGAVTDVESSLRSIDQLVDRPLNTTAQPPVSGATLSETVPGASRASSISEYEDLLADAWTKRVSGWATQGKLPLHSAIVPGSTEVGYDIRGNHAILIARRLVEVDFGNGYSKQYWVVVPLFE